MAKKGRKPAVTMSDVGRVAGVSSTTVSHVINKTRYIRPETEQAVLAAIESTGYSGDAIARSLRTGATQTVGVAMTAISNPHFAGFVHAIERHLSNSGFSLVLADTHDDPVREQRAVAEILSHRVDGMIVASASDSTTVVDTLRRRQLPTVFIDRIPEKLYPGMDAVGVENAGSTAQLVDHLTWHGHQRIALVLPPLVHSTIRERRRGYELGLERNDIRPDPSLVVIGNQSEATAAEAVDQLFALKEPPTAIVSSNNEMTLGVMREFRRRGIRVPDDIALAVFDDFEWADFFAPRLTAIAQPVNDIGRLAVEMLLDRLGNRDRDAEPRQERLEPRFELRDSCGCVTGPPTA